MRDDYNALMKQREDMIFRAYLIQSFMREIMPLFLNFYERDFFTTPFFLCKSFFSFLNQVQSSSCKTYKKNISYTHITTLLSFS